jgi:IMP dehydrogenase
MATNDYVAKFMDEFPYQGLTFDDVSLITQYADFLPDEANMQSRLTSRISVNMPFLSAAMDTVTESRMAISMALLGGIGIIHKNLSVDEQVRQVGVVKHHLHGLIRDPITFRTSDTLDTVRERCGNRKFSFSGFPILDENDNVAGILTSTDIKYSEDEHACVSDVMSCNVISAAPDTDQQTAYGIMMKNKIGKLPLVEKGKLVGLYSFSDVSTLVRDVKPLYNRDSKYRLRVGAAVSPNNESRVEALANEGVDVIVVDSAHGHTKGVMDMTRWIAKHYPDIDIIAGNVGTGEGAVALRDAVAHAVKVGIGPGSICTTRVVCGVGIPQITAIHAAQSALEGSVPVVADGGIRHSGDVPKAIVAGADTVMLGSILAGTEESPGEKIIHQGRQYVVYRGMGSLSAMQQGTGSRERYSQADVDADDLVPQGIEGIVPYAGTVQKVMTQFCGGLTSSMGYCGCRDIPALQSNGKFTRVSSAGLHEAHPHDVKIMKEAPNYRS